MKTTTTDATPPDKDPLDDMVGVTHSKPQPTVLEEEGEEKKNPKEKGRRKTRKMTTTTTITITITTSISKKNTMFQNTITMAYLLRPSS